MVITWSQVYKKRKLQEQRQDDENRNKKLIHWPEIKTKYREKLEEKLNNQTDKTWKHCNPQAKQNKVVKDKTGKL